MYSWFSTVLIRTTILFNLLIALFFLFSSPFFTLLCFLSHYASLSLSVFSPTHFATCLSFLLSQSHTLFSLDFPRHLLTIIVFRSLCSEPAERQRDLRVFTNTNQDVFRVIPMQMDKQT